MMDVGRENLFLAFFAISGDQAFFVGEGVGVLRPQTHVTGENAVAVRVVEGLEVVPFFDGHRRECREHVVGERGVAGLFLDLVFYLEGSPTGGLVRHRGVQRVELIFEENFPVRVLNHAKTIRHDLDLPHWGAVAHIVEGDLRGPEELGERRAVVGEACEHEAAVGFNARRGLHVAVGIGAGEFRALVAGFHHRDVLQLAVMVKRPSVVGAAEELAGITVAVAAHHVAAMRTAIVEHAHLPVIAAHHQHRLTPDLHGVIVAGFRHLAVVAAVNPHALVDAFHLEPENIGVGIDMPVNAVGLDQRGEVGNSFVQHGGPPVVDGATGSVCTFCGQRMSKRMGWQQHTSRVTHPGSGAKACGPHRVRRSGLARRPDRAR